MGTLTSLMIYIYIHTMMTSYIKGTAECIFMHIHLEHRFGIYIFIPVFVVPNIEESLQEFNIVVGETKFVSV